MERNGAMSRTEITTYENAGRMATAWLPEGYDGQTHFGPFLTALAPAVFILCAAATVLVSVV